MRYSNRIGIVDSQTLRTQATRTKWSNVPINQGTAATDKPVIVTDDSEEYAEEDGAPDSGKPTYALPLDYKGSKTPLQPIKWGFIALGLAAVAGTVLLVNSSRKKRKKR